MCLALSCGHGWATELAVDIKAGERHASIPGVGGMPCPSGGYLLSRTFTVGDEAVFRISDLFSKVQTGMLALKVTRVDANADRVELNNGEWVMNLKGNFVKTPDSGPQAVPQLIVPDELQAGNNWSAKWVEQGPQRFAPIRLDMKVAAFEKVSTPAGEFDAFRIEGKGWFGRTLPMSRIYWVSPELNFPVRYEHMLEGPPGRINIVHLEADQYELVSLRQHVAGVKCLTSGRP